MAVPHPAAGRMHCALNLYTVRDHLADPGRVPDVLARVRALGVETVVISGLPDLPDAGIRAMIRDAGLSACNLHAASDMLRTDPERVAERLDHLDCPMAAFGWPDGVDWKSSTSIGALIEDLQAATDCLGRHGRQLAYRHHGMELTPHPDRPDRSSLAVLLEACPGMMLEPSTYWLQVCGGGPAAWCARVSGRMPVLLLQDVTGSPDNTPAFADVGHGHLDIPRILRAAAAAGCRHIAIDRDECPDIDSLDAVTRSLETLRPMLDG